MAFKLSIPKPPKLAMAKAPKVNLGKVKSPKPFIQRQRRYTPSLNQKGF